MTTTDAVATDVRARRLRILGYGLLALLAYVPVLLTKPGKVVADTKSYLYLDPGRLLERAASMWDPNIGMGTVTHQNIGYLFPMGPYYWVLHLAGVPAWVSQRLWLGSILFAAALGVLFLLRTLSVRGPGAVVATVLFMLTPYTLDFAARISVILLPWAGLPWMLALTIRALRAPDRRGSWRYAAIFAIVVQIVGGVNATALVFAGIAPVLWIVYATIVGEVDWRRALGVTARIALLTVLTSLWWIAGLWAQSGYGLNILKFTETLRVVSLSSLPSEVLRGLGYWFFYGIDRVGHWTDASVPYSQNLGLLVVSFAIPVLALFGAACIKWRHRAYFVVLTVVGVVVAVGANPYDDPSVVGGLFKSFAESSSFGLALRSTSRAVPLVALGLAVLLGVAVNAVGVAWQGKGRAVGGVSVRTLVLAGVIVVLAVVNLPALWTGAFYTQDLTRDEAIPQYWTDAIAALDAQPHDTRVLEIPGADFAAYRWGQTVDPITPGLMDRPYVARELVPWGSAASADLLNALDQRLQEGTLDPAAIAPIAKLMSVGSVVYRADLQTDRYDLARAVPDLAAPHRARSRRSRRPDAVRVQPGAAAAGHPGRRGAARVAPRCGEPAAGERVPGAGRAVDRAQRRRVGPAHRVGRRRGTRRPRDDRRAAGERRGALLGDVREPTGPVARRGRATELGARRHRFEPQAGATVDERARRLRRDRTRRPVGAGEGRERQSARRVSRRRVRRLHRRPDARGRGEHESLRRSRVLRAGAARVARVRR